MKFLNIFLMLLIANFCLAQKVDQQSRTMSLGSQNAYVISVDGADNDIMEDTWKAYVKEYGKIKENKKAKELVTEQAKVALISGTTPATLYAKIEEGKNQGTLYLWVDHGTGFVNAKDNASQSAGIETFLKDYWVIARKKAITKELEMEEKRAKELAKEQVKLEDKKKDYLSEIEKCKLKIAEAEKNIEINASSQKTKKLEIEAQKKAVQAVTEKLNAVGKSM
jgi:hypothetical protein